MLETSGSPGVADLQSARHMLKGKAIVLKYNERIINETSWYEPTKEQNRFIYIPIHTMFSEDNRLRLNTGSLKKSQELFMPFYSFEEEEFQMFSLQ